MNERNRVGYGDARVAARDGERAFAAPNGEEWPQTRPLARPAQGERVFRDESVVDYHREQAAAQGYVRPYDFRWGAAQQVQDEFHISPVTLKAAAAAGHIKALQPTYQDDEHRAQCVYCFEDIHNFMENVMHKLSREYVKKFWTYPELVSAARRMPAGPYQRLDDMGGGHGEDRGERFVG
jgi:hypothetical protein